MTIDNSLKVKGLIKKADGSWRSANSVDELLEASDEDVIFAESVEEATNALDAKYPASHPKLSRVLVTTQRDWQNNENTVVLSVKLYDCDVYTGGNESEAAELAKELKKVWVSSGLYVHGRDHCYSGYSDKLGLRFVVYDPSREERQKKARLNREARRPIRMQEVQRITLSLCDDICNYVPGYRRVAGNDWSETFLNLNQVIAIHSSIFGRFSWRKNEAFQNFLEIWKLRGEASREKIVKVKPKRVRHVYDSWLSCVEDRYGHYKLNENQKQEYADRLKFDHGSLEKLNKQHDEILKNNFKFSTTKWNAKSGVALKAFKWFDKELKARKPKSMTLKKPTVETFI